MTQQNPKQLFPMIVTEKLAETKRYYTEKARFKVVVDMPHYLQVEALEPGGPQLCFMAPDGMPDGKRLAPFAGQGLVVSIPTQSADEKYLQLKTDAAQLLSEPKDMPWGWRSFMAVDPNGVVLDFFHVLQSEATGAS